ncbi:MAG: AbrB family transcriptional regulator [Alphaproteobacteria bacterium]
MAATSMPNRLPLPTNPPNATPNSGKARAAIRHDLTKFCYTVAIGAMGGALFAFFDLPLAWMLGAMVASALAAFLQVPVKIDPRVRTVMLIVLGTMLGSSFSPEILARVADWSLSIGALALYAIAAGAVGFFIYRRLFGYPLPTAFFAGAPGGFNEMVMMGTAMGGDERTISLSHATRVFIVVMIIPFWFRFSGNYQPVAQIAAAGPDTQFGDLAILATGALVGLLIAKLLRIPAPHLTGPMMSSALIHLLGWTAATPPLVLVALSQVVIGAAIGTRFSGIGLASLARTVRAGTFVSATMTLLSLSFATILASITGFAFAPLLLAFAPGGLAEMSLVALALNVDTAFVATHHIARIIMVVVLAPVIFRLIRGRKPPPS